VRHLQPAYAPASGLARRLLPVRLLALLALVLLPSAGLVALAGPASAATRSVELTEAAASVEIDVGDSLIFINGESSPLGRSHQVTGRVSGTSYDSTLLEPGEQSAETPAFTSSGTFSLQDERTAIGTLVDPRTMSVTVVVRAPAASPSPAPSGGGDESISDPTSPATKDTPSTSGGTATKKKQPATQKSPEPTKSPAKKKTAAEAGTSPRSATTASPVPTGGTGYALQPNLDTGALLMPGSGNGPGGPAPAVAPVLPEDPALLLGQGSPVSYQADQQLAVRGALPGSLTVRRYGLPIALAVVALAGVGSLLVRVLLAEPTARRATASPA